MNCILKENLQGGFSLWHPKSSHNSKKQESSQFGKEEVDSGDKHFGLLAAVLLTNSAARLGKSRQ